MSAGELGDDLGRLIGETDEAITSVAERRVGTEEQVSVITEAIEGMDGLESTRERVQQVALWIRDQWLKIEAAKDDNNSRGRRYIEDVVATRSLVADAARVTTGSNNPNAQDMVQSYQAAGGKNEEASETHNEATSKIMEVTHKLGEAYHKIQEVAGVLAMLGDDMDGTRAGFAQTAEIEGEAVTALEAAKASAETYAGQI
jgi:hypothetical protein